MHQINNITFEEYIKFRKAEAIRPESGCIVICPVTNTRGNRVINLFASRQPLAWRSNTISNLSNCRTAFRTTATLKTPLADTKSIPC